MVALRTIATIIVLKVWNNQLNQPPFLLFFSFIIRLLEFRDFLLLQYQSKKKKDKKKNDVDEYKKLLHILIFSEHSSSSVLRNRTKFVKLPISTMILESY